MVSERPLGRVGTRLLRYGTAVGSVGLALLLSLWLRPLMERNIFSWFLIAVLISAWYGGIEPWLLATVLSVLALDYFFMAPYHSLAVGSGSDQARLGLFVMGALVILWLSEARRRARKAEREQRQWLRVTLSSIGDAVIATDMKAVVTFMNPVAERLTGWSLPEAVGRPLADVFHIVNEETRQPVESPANHVLREGAAVGLANHTLLIAKDGSEIPIDDSGAPIRDDEGNAIGVVLVFHDITERQQTEAARRESEKRYRYIVETASEGIWIIDAEGRTTYVNPQLAEMLGYTPEEMLGHIPCDFLFSEDIPEAADKFNQKRQGARDRLDFRLRRKDGAAVWAHISTSPIFDDNGQFLGVIGMFIDITERKQAEQERERLMAREHAARAAAEEASRLKDEFLATISHELRTPLTAILGWARLLRAGGLDEATAARALETVERNAQAQAQLIADLLDVSRIISGKLRLNVQPVELALVIEDALDAVRPAAEAKSIRLQVALDPKAGPVSGDPTRLQQVVWNLLSNAIKFTPPGGHVQVRLTRADAGVEITVQDTGQGIRPEFLPYVFDRFRQADSSSTRLHGGLGLGLAIVRHLVELHGGAVEVESPGEGQGATFRVRLPILPAPLKISELAHGFPAARKELPFEDAPALEGLNVLVVDDEIDTLDFLTLLFKKWYLFTRLAGLW